MSFSELTRYPVEPLVRAHSQSMRAEGWIGPIVVLEHAGEKYILDGHHRCWAARHAIIDVKHRTIDPGDVDRFGYSTVQEVVIAHAEAGPNRIRLR